MSHDQDHEFEAFYRRFIKHDRAKIRADIASDYQLCEDEADNVIGQSLLILNLKWAKCKAAPNEAFWEYARERAERYLIGADMSDTTATFYRSPGFRRSRGRGKSFTYFLRSCLRRVKEALWEALPLRLTFEKDLMGYEAREAALDVLLLSREECEQVVIIAWAIRRTQEALTALPIQLEGTAKLQQIDVSSAIQPPDELKPYALRLARLSEEHFQKIVCFFAEELSRDDLETEPRWHSETEAGPSEAASGGQYA